MSKQVDLSWNNFKTIVSSKVLSVQYDDLGDTYDVFAVEEEILWQASLYKGSSESTDFETNYKPTANQRIITNVNMFDGSNHPLTSTTLGAKQALDVNLISTMTYTSARFRPRFYTSKTVTSISKVSDTQIASLNFNGQLSGISVNFNKKETSLILIVDSTEIFRAALSDLSDSAIYDLHDAGEEYDFRLTTHDNHILLSWDTPADILTNLTIKAIASGDNVTTKGVIVMYREMV